MSSDLDRRSPLVRFCDSFLQERNIQWMLGLGMLILLGSSVMLVTAHWEQYTPVWKYLLLVGYTAGIFVGGEVSYRHLGLRRTGTGLMALTVLLLPVTFLALRWVRPGEAFTPRWLLQDAGLLALNFGFSLIAARRVFRHFLRGEQPTFLACYLALCLAGAVVPGLPAAWSPAVAFVLWAVFAVGAVKVNRHVFWLGEEHRLPRIFGFFPIGLLGSQFVMLFAVSLAPHIPLQWLGLAAVLVAVPVLLTADTVARVFQQRTGDLVRPLPWSIVAPLALGLVLCAGGVILAATAMPRPYALAPTAALVAAMMTVVARRTNQPAFVWAMLAGMLIAYNFSPVFFRDLAHAAAHHGALAIQEKRLPLAFYGLTYLPLLAVLTGCARRLSAAGQELFARPIRQLTVGLACVLLALSFGHSKAIFPVGAALAGLFAAQTLLDRDRRLMIPGVLAWIAAAFGLTPFLTGVLGLAVPADMPLLCLGIAAGSLLVVGRRLDRFGESLPSQPGTPLPICQLASLLLSLILPGLWLGWFGLHPGGGLASGILLAVLLTGQALWWLRPGLGEVALVFTGLLAASHAVAAAVPVTTMISAGAIGLAALWLAAYGLERIPGRRLSRAFARPAYHVSLAGLMLLLVLYALPMFAVSTARPELAVSWIGGGLAVVWAFDAARRAGRAGLTVLGSMGVLGLVAALTARALGAPAGWEWLPAAWAIAATLAVPLAIRLGSTDRGETCRRAIGRPLNVIVPGVLILVAVASLGIFSLPLRAAGAVALAGLFWLSVSGRRPVLRLTALILANWQILCLVIGAIVPAVRFPLMLDWNEVVRCALPLAFVAAVSVLAFRLRPRRNEADPSGVDLEADLVDVHIILLRFVSAAGLLISLTQLPAGLSPWQGLFALGTLAALIVREFWSAYRTGDEARVWTGEGLAAVALGYFALFGLVEFGDAVSLFAAPVGGLALWTLGRLASRNPRTAVFSVPFTRTGLALPLATVAAALYRHVAFPEPHWKGLNSLALLLAAGFYFWRGLEGRRPLPLILSAVVMNAALALLWRELAWSDPQFFMIPLGVSILGMVELLKCEIPRAAHDPLRYLGALVILVSPTFHIVGGSWLHLLTLMVASVAVTLLAIGLRVRALIYTGTAFLAADIVAMVVRGSIDHPSLLWVAGIVVGAAVTALAAYCEEHRELVLRRLRLIAAKLETWE